MQLVTTLQLYKELAYFRILTVTAAEKLKLTPRRIQMRTHLERMRNCPCEVREVRAPELTETEAQDRD